LAAISCKVPALSPRTFQWHGSMRRRSSTQGSNARPTAIVKVDTGSNLAPIDIRSGSRRSRFETASLLDQLLSCLSSPSLPRRRAPRRLRNQGCGALLFRNETDSQRCFPARGAQPSLQWGWPRNPSCHFADCWKQHDLQCDCAFALSQVSRAHVRGGSDVSDRGRIGHLGLYHDRVG
jgi:hypothetical protein